MKKALLADINRLNYDKNDLIIKEGDYGVSIYYIRRGRVEVYTQTEGSVSRLALLEAGEIFGEMVFLYGSKISRTASVRAVEPTVLEVYHQSRFLAEYKKMSPMLKYITDQALMDLVKTNRKIANIDQELRESFAKGPWSASRGHLDLCAYIASEESHRDGAVILCGNFVSIILKGKAQVKKKTPKGEIVIDYLEEGNVFGKGAIFDASNFQQVSLVADGPLTLGVLDGQKLDGDWVALPPSLRALIASLVRKRREALDTFLSMSANPYDRIRKVRK